MIKKRSQAEAVFDTEIRRAEQYEDRWSSYGRHTGIVDLSERLTPSQMREFEIFQDSDDAFLQKISPDVSVAVWAENSVLFEEGSYIDIAFCIVRGEVDVSLELTKSDRTLAGEPIFDPTRTIVADPDMVKSKAPGKPRALARPRPPGGSRRRKDRSRKGDSSIALLSTMDFDMPAGTSIRLGPGEFFGEIGALSGWPQSVTSRTASECVLIQIRIPALRAMKRKSPALKERIDTIYKERSLSSQLLRTPLFRDCPQQVIDRFKSEVELLSCDPGEVIVREGDLVDALYLVRSGFVKLTQAFGEGQLMTSYLSKGMTLGETELLLPELDRWEVTASSVEWAELVRIPEQTFREALSSTRGMEDRLWRAVEDRIQEAGHSRRNIGHAEFNQVALDKGLIQGNSILVINLDDCTRCDDCVRACAATHGGRPRFVREGNKYDNLLIAKSCYHCQDPVCLVGCPTGAIHRAGLADLVEIDEDICIGCGTCAKNCPYDSIVMHEPGETWPADMVPEALRGQDRKVASKCDLCHSAGHEPACVTNCPQGCATRVGSLFEIQELLGGLKAEA